MSRSAEFNDILNDCLERILVKGEDLEQCLRDYPGHVAELKPLLETALTAQKVTNVEPRPEFRTRARYQFRLALQEAAARRGHRFFIWRPVWGTVVAVVLVFVLASGVTVAAAGNSMPDEALYPVKVAAEEVRLTLTPSPVGKAELNAELADRRVAEIIHLAHRGKSEDIERVTQRLNYELETIAEVSASQTGMKDAALAPAPGALSQPGMATAPAPRVPPGQYKKEGGVRGSGDGDRERLKTAVARYVAGHPQVLREALKTAPDSVKPALRRALAVAEAGYQKARRSLEQ